MADGPLGSVWIDEGKIFKKKQDPSRGPSLDGEKPIGPYCQGGVRINLHHAHFPNYTAIRSQHGAAVLFFFGGEKHGEVECHKSMTSCFEMVVECF